MKKLAIVLAVLNRTGCPTVTSTAAIRFKPRRSPNQVMAGTVISATLLTGINSDLPGQVIAWPLRIIVNKDIVLRPYRG